MRVQIQQREEVWRFDRIKDHDTVSVVAWSRTRKHDQQEAECGRSAGRSMDRCGMQSCEALAVPSDDRCPWPLVWPSASRHGFSTLRANTQRQTDSSIRCAVGHAQHVVRMRHEELSILTNAPRGRGARERHLYRGMAI